MTHTIGMVLTVTGLALIAFLGGLTTAEIIREMRGLK